MTSEENLNTKVSISIEPIGIKNVAQTFNSKLSSSSGLFGNNTFVTRSFPFTERG